MWILGVEQCYWYKATKNTMFNQWLGEWWEGMKRCDIAKVEESIVPTQSAADTLEIVSKLVSPMWSGNRQVTLTGGLKGLSLLENGHVRKPGMHRDIEFSNAASFALSNQQATGVRESGMLYTGTSQSMAVHSVIDDANASFRETITYIKYDTVAPSGTDPYIVARNTLSTMSNSSLKVYMNRPVRHLGPPSGFSSVRPKQVNEHGPALG